MRAESTGRPRFEALDGVRGIAILLVVWCHATSVAVDSCNHPAAQPGLAAAVSCAPVYYGGGVGVMLFFALSGFLLFLPYAQAILAPEHAYGGWPSTRGFYVRRARRILPAYYPALALLVVLPWLVAAFRLHLAPTQLPWGGFLAGVMLVYDLGRGVFTTVAGADGPLWSLTVEWQFYFVLPLLAVALRWLAGRGNREERTRRLLLSLVAVMAVGVAVRGAAPWAYYRFGYSSPEGAAPGPFGVAFALLYGINGKFLEVFATGMMTSVLYVARPDVLARISRRSRWPTTVALAGLALCGAWAATCGPFSGLAQPFSWPVSDGSFGIAAWSWDVFGQWVMGLCSALLLLVALAPVPATTWKWGWGWVCRLAPLRGLGFISYSLYLWHLPFLAVVFGPKPLPPLASVERIVLGSLFAIAFAYASYRLIERPFLTSHRRDRSDAATSPTLLPAVAKHR